MSRKKKERKGWETRKVKERNIIPKYINEKVFIPQQLYKNSEKFRLHLFSSTTGHLSSCLTHFYITFLFLFTNTLPCHCSSIGMIQIRTFQVGNGWSHPFTYFTFSHVPYRWKVWQRLHLLLTQVKRMCTVSKWSRIIHYNNGVSSDEISKWFDGIDLKLIIDEKNFSSSLNEILEKVMEWKCME